MTTQDLRARFPTLAAWMQPPSDDDVRIEQAADALDQRGDHDLAQRLRDTIGRPQFSSVDPAEVRQLWDQLFKRTGKRRRRNRFQGIRKTGRCLWLVAPDMPCSQPTGNRHYWCAAHVMPARNDTEARTAAMTRQQRVQNWPAQDPTYTGANGTTKGADR